MHLIARGFFNLPSTTWQRTHILIAHQSNLISSSLHSMPLLEVCYLPQVSLKPATFWSLGERYKHTATGDEVYNMRCVSRWKFGVYWMVVIYWWCYNVHMFIPLNVSVWWCKEWRLWPQKTKGEKWKVATNYYIQLFVEICTRYVTVS